MWENEGEGSIRKGKRTVSEKSLRGDNFQNQLRKITKTQEN